MIRTLPVLSGSQDCDRAADDDHEAGGRHRLPRDVQRRREAQAARRLVQGRRRDLTGRRGERDLPNLHLRTGEFS